MACLELDSHHSQHLFPIVYGHVGDKYFSPFRVLNPVRKHLLSVQCPLHVRVNLMLNQVPRIAEVRLRLIQAVDKIHELAVLIHLCGIEIPDTGNLPDPLERFMGLLIDISLHIFPGPYLVKGALIQTFLHISVYGLCLVPQTD